MQRKRPVNTQTKEQLDKRMDNISKMKWGENQATAGGQMIPDINNRPNGQKRIKPVTSATVAQQIAARNKAGKKIEHDYQWGDDIKKEVQERNQELHDKHQADPGEYEEFLAWKKAQAKLKKQEDDLVDAVTPIPNKAGSLPATNTDKSDDDVYKFSAHARRMIREGKISSSDADDLYVHLGRKVLKADLDGII